MKRWWPYTANLLALGGCVTEFVDVASGHGLSNDMQLIWIGIVAAWIGNHAWIRHMYDTEVDRRNNWVEISERWRKLYELASQKRRSMWS